jgi:hypothetical protein
VIFGIRADEDKCSGFSRGGQANLRNLRMLGGHALIAARGVIEIEWSRLASFAEAVTHVRPEFNRADSNG